MSFIKDLMALLAQAARMFFWVIAGFIAFGAARIALRGYPSELYAEWYGFALCISLVALCGATVVICHELGHAAAARLAGWRVHVIVVGPVAYRPRARRFVRAAKSDGGDRWGFVGATPPVGADWQKGRATVFLGGVVANAITAGAALGLLVFYSPLELPGALLVGFAAISTAFAVDNLIPRELSGGAKNDGAVLLDIVKGERVSPNARDISWLAGYLNDGVDCRAWDPALMKRLETAKLRPREDAMRNGALLTRYLALGDVVRAYELLETWQPPGRAGAAALIERAFLVAVVERDAQKASALLDDVPERTWGGQYFYWRARMALHGLRGEADAARDAVARARALIKAGGLRADGDDLALMERCENGEPPPLHFGQGA